jgi:carbamoyl-phosphate synthase large subunit
MKSTGEVMGVGESFAEAFMKSQLAAGVKMPRAGKVFISVRDADKPRVVELAKLLMESGFTLVATRGTASALAAAGVAVTPVNKVHEGQPHIVDLMKNDEIALVVNTVQEKRSAIEDSKQIRREALTGEIPTYTTVAGARAAALGIAGMRELVPYAIQALHERLH